MEAPQFGSLFAGVGGFDLGMERAGFRCAWQVEIDPHCRQLLREKFPHTRIRKDVRDAGAKNLARVGLICGGFPCFVGGTLILSKRGLIPIEDVVVGDLVWTHRNRWRVVNSVMHREAESTVVLSGGLHYGLATTDEHPFWASVGRIRKYKRATERRRGNWYDMTWAEPKWTPAAHMQGLYWSSPVIDGSGAPPPCAPVKRGNCIPEFTPALLWVVGFWVGDGWLCKNRGRVSGAVFITPKAHTEEIKTRFDAAGLQYCLDAGESTDKIVVSHRAFGVWLEQHFGEYCHGKQIPTWLLESRREFRQAFLEGYAWADGCEKDGGWSISTVNKNLAVGTALLARSLNFHCMIYRSENPETCVIEGRTCLQQRYGYEIRIRPFRKQTSAFVLGVAVFAKCRKVVRSGPETVYNIGVQEDESYVADGLIVHNCQDLSVAGRGRGLAGERSGLFFEFMRIVQGLTPSWVLIENVPGLLSNDGGRAMGTVLGRLGQLGYGWAYRVLDAQWFGVAQRRRRVFIVGCLGDWRRAAEVLFERESLPWDSPPSREAGARVAASPANRLAFGGNNTRGPIDVATACNAKASASERQDFESETFVTHTLRAEGFDTSEDGTGRGTPIVACHDTGQGWWNEASIAGTLRAEGENRPSRPSNVAVFPNMAVRRLTPRECERLQGFPDDWTAGFSDSCRYRMLGNAVCVPVAEWIGRRLIEYFEAEQSP